MQTRIVPKEQDQRSGPNRYPEAQYPTESIPRETRNPQEPPRAIWVTDPRFRVAIFRKEFWDGDGGRQTEKKACERPVEQRIHMEITIVITPPNAIPAETSLPIYGPSVVTTPALRSGRNFLAFEESDFYIGR